MNPNPRCLHLISHIDEVAHRLHCQQCGASGQHQEIISKPEFEVATYRYEYCPIKSFMQYVSLIEDKYYGELPLPDPLPLGYGYIKMLQAYKHCSFADRGKIFTKSFLLYKLSQIVAESEPAFKAWINAITQSGKMPSGDCHSKQERRWTEIERNIHPDWQLKNLTYKPLLGSSVCRRLR